MHLDMPIISLQSPSQTWLMKGQEEESLQMPHKIQRMGRTRPISLAKRTDSYPSNLNKQVLITTMMGRMKRSNFQLSKTRWLDHQEFHKVTPILTNSITWVGWHKDLTSCNLHQWEPTLLVSFVGSQMASRPPTTFPSISNLCNSFNTNFNNNKPCSKCKDLETKVILMLIF